MGLGVGLGGGLVSDLMGSFPGIVKQNIENVVKDKSAQDIENEIQKEEDIELLDIVAK